MNVEKMKKWLELTNQVKKDDFWSNVFNHKDPQMFFDMERDIPLYDVYKNETHISIIFELPGCNKTRYQDFSEFQYQITHKRDCKTLVPYGI